MGHVWGDMDFCIRCGTPAMDWVERGRPECTAPENARSIVNELAKRRLSAMVFRLYRRNIDA